MFLGGGISPWLCYKILVNDTSLSSLEKQTMKESPRPTGTLVSTPREKALLTFVDIHSSYLLNRAEQGAGKTLKQSGTNRHEAQDRLVRIMMILGPCRSLALLGYTGAS